MKRRGRKKRIEGVDHRTSSLKSVERTLDVLEFLSKTRSIGITELADILKVGTSTAHRVLSTLEKKGFAVQDTDTGKYALGHMVFQLARSVIYMIEPLKYVRPHLEELCKKTGENVAFGVITPGKDRTLILAEQITDKAIIARPILFQRLFLHICACGKAYLATLNDQQLKAALFKDNMVRFTEYTPISLDAIKEQLMRFRKLGYTLSKDEFSVGLSAMASGICDAEDKFAGAIIIVGPSFRFTDKNIKDWGKLLLATTSRLSLEFKAKGIV
ncbi:MAG: IclR family transcriptional regulator [Candidatus Omnitrophica bacterium]|nr:IclR family transcriptional regulator [Candidatus Omnitrophota bacterium]MBU1809164.1 IclR family transcriptional regulator [Candidatus Omnitrophota bacterium]